MLNTEQILYQVQCSVAVCVNVIEAQYYRTPNCDCEQIKDDTLYKTQNKKDFKIYFYNDK